MKKQILALTLGIGIGVGGKMVVDGVSDGSLVLAVRKQKVQSHIEEQLPQVMANLERELDLTFHGVPNIDLDQRIEEGISGKYNPHTDSISVDYEHILLPFKEGINGWLNLANYGEAIEPYGVLQHELGHFYVDKVREALGLSENTPSRAQLTRLKMCAQGEVTLMNDPEFQAVVGNEIMNEGIADYFEYGPLAERELNQLNWPRYTGVFMLSGEGYYWGHRLVSPIIEQFGAQGIEYLVTHPPRDPTRLGEYQQEALRELAAR